MKHMFPLCTVGALLAVLAAHAAVLTGLIVNPTTEGTFEWISGEPVGFPPPWGGLMPNDGTAGNYVVLQIQASGSLNAGEWNDVPDDGSGRAIVEIVPEPGSLSLLGLGGLALLHRRR